MTIEESKHKENRQYKDRVFKFIFQDPAFALPLINALMGMEYNDPEEIEITTLEDHRSGNGIRWFRCSCCGGARSCDESTGGRELLHFSYS